MKYIPITLNDDIVIRSLYTVFYFEYTKDYAFHGEKHDFWEMLYVDKGEVIATADNKEILLKQGDIIFHKPNEWHNIRANNVVAPNLFIITFDSKSKAMKLLRNKVFTISDTQKTLLSQILDECTKAFSNELNDYKSHLTKRNEIPFGTLQLIKLHLTEFLISLIRKDESKTRSLLRYHTKNSLFNAIVDFMHNNISNKLTFDDVVEYANLSGSSVKRLFKENTNVGVIEYYINLKMDYAKKYIREGDYNMTQIANMLGYDNIHYFSKQFKTQTGMSPSEYAKSIKALSQKIKENEE